MLGRMRVPADVRPRTALPARSKRLGYAGSSYVARTMRRASHITRPAGRARGAALASEGRVAAGARPAGGGPAGESRGVRWSGASGIPRGRVLCDPPPADLCRVGLLTIPCQV